MFNFDEVIDRKSMSSKKWDPKFYGSLFNGKEVEVSLWVADMDFKVAPAILEHLKKVVEHGVLGYTYSDQDYFNSIIQWFKKRRGIELKKDWIVYTNGVVGGIAYAVQSFTEVGDNVMIQRPVYGPFSMIVQNNNRNVVDCPLIYSNGKYSVDFEEFERKIIDNNVKMFILCNPHNPIGKVWKREELESFARICHKHNVLVISDEIHSDLIYKDSVFTSFLHLDSKYHENLIVCTSPSKTFNLAAVQISNLIIPNAKLMEMYRKTLSTIRLEYPNTFGMEGLKAAYLYGEEWLEEVLDYLDENRRLIATFLEENIPNARYNMPEGTYLAWIDFNDVIPAGMSMEEFFEDRAKIAVDYGDWFGETGRGFIRLNFACPRSVLLHALNNIKAALPY